MTKRALVGGALLALSAFSATASGAEPLPGIEPFQAQAAKFNEILTIPHFEQSPAEIEQSTAATLAAADAGLEKIGKQDPGGVAFATTAGALDDVVYPVATLSDRLGLIQNTSTDPAMREAAENASKKVQEWSVGIDYREDVYQAIRAYAKTEPKLAGEEARLLEETLRDYRRAGLELPPAQRQQVEALRKELGNLSTDFQANVLQAKAPVTFSRAELDGVPADFLDSPKIKTGDDRYTIAANETYQYIMVEQTARSEETRRKLYVARDDMARDKNLPLFNRILGIRNDIALKLGYASWADYQTEVKMVKTGAKAEHFIDELIAGTQPKFDAERAEMQQRKAADTHRPDSILDTWDWHYYADQIMKTRYDIDTEALRVYFPLDRVLDGLFRVYAHCFGLRFTQIQAPYTWAGGVSLYVAADARSGEPLGLFYLDMFPREGKYNHYAEFSILPGKQLPDGKYQRPVVSLVCNFPPPGPGDRPSLFTHEDVVTVFHEFGHALHGMLTRARFARFAGTNVPNDFVEAPSQMLENWPWDKTVLDSFAADYRDPAKKIPPAILGKMKEAKLAIAGMTYRRQFAFAKLDLVLHGPHPAAEPYDCNAVANRILQQVFLPIDPRTAFIAGFGHLMDGYDAGYYGYAWAESIAADMAEVFRHAPGGFMDETAGMKLRTEIYEPGDSRDVGVSIEKFLGRPMSIEPFLENNLGLKPNPPTAQ